MFDSLAGDEQRHRLSLAPIEASMKNLWQHGANNAESAFGKNISLLETEWRAEPAKVNLKSISYNQ
jgi:hypothetical protein